MLKLTRSLGRLFALSKGATRPWHLSSVLIAISVAAWGYDGNLLGAGDNLPLVHITGFFEEYFGDRINVNGSTEFPFYLALEQFVIRLGWLIGVEVGTVQLVTLAVSWGTVAYLASKLTIDGLYVVSNFYTSLLSVAIGLWTPAVAALATNPINLAVPSSLIVILLTLNCLLQPPRRFWNMFRQGLISGVLITPVLANFALAASLFLLQLVTMLFFNAVLREEEQKRTDICSSRNRNILNFALGFGLVSSLWIPWTFASLVYLKQGLVGDQNITDLANSNWMYIRYNPINILGFTSSWTFGPEIGLYYGDLVGWVVQYLDFLLVVPSLICVGFVALKSQTRKFGVLMAFWTFCVLLQLSTVRPLRTAFVVLMNYIPSIAAFREPTTKFVNWQIFAVLISVRLLTREYEDKNKNSKIRICYILFVGTTLIPTALFMSGALLDRNGLPDYRVKDSNELGQLVNLFESVGERFSIAILPSPNNYESYSWDYQGADPVRFAIGNRGWQDRLTYFAEQDPKNDVLDELFTRIEQGNLQSAVDLATKNRILYVLLRRDLVRLRKSADSAYMNLGESPTIVKVGETSATTFSIWRITRMTADDIADDSSRVAIQSPVKIHSRSR
jgi:hypothetical protein